MKSIKITGDFSIEEIQNTKREPLKRKTTTVHGPQEYLIKDILIKFKMYREDRAFIQKVKPKDVQGKYGKPYKELPLNFKGALPGNYFWLTKPLKVTPDTYDNNYVVDINELRNSCIPYRKAKAKTPVYTRTGIEREDLTLDIVKKNIKDYKPATNGIAAELFLNRSFKGKGFSMDEFLSLCEQRGRPVKTKTKNGKPHGGFARVFEAAKALQHLLGDRGKVLMAQENNGIYQLILEDKYKSLPTHNRYKVLNTKSKEEQLVVYA